METYTCTVCSQQFERRGAGPVPLTCGKKCANKRRGTGSIPDGERIGRFLVKRVIINGESILCEKVLA